MQKSFFHIDNQCVHLRQAGTGSPIVLLHASPSSSKMLMPLINILADRYCVLAIDIPGYGLSQPLEGEWNEMIDYARFFHRLFDHLGLERFALYGTATGAQIAIRYANEYPEQVAHLFLDNAAHFSEVQRSEILAGYFPNLSPKADGSHLTQTWTIVRNLFTFFPWSIPKPSNRLKAAFPPATVLHQVVMDFFQAGDDYARAYRAAFRHEDARNVCSLKVPTSLLVWEGSIIRPYMLQLLEADLPMNVKVSQIPASRTERFAKMRETIIGCYQDAIKYQFQEEPKTRQERQLYLRHAEGDLHAICQFNESDFVPVVLLHEAGSSAAVAIQKYKAQYSDGNSIIAVSLSGHGDSDVLNRPFSVEKELPELLRSLGVESFRLHVFPQPAPLPKLIPDEYGMYLFKAWHFLQDRYLFTDPVKKDSDGLLLEGQLPGPELLQLELREWLKCRV